MKKNAKIIFLSTFLTIFVLMLIFGSIYDLQISKALADLESGKYYSTNLFATIFETFGESIVYILSTISLAILFFKVRTANFKYDWLKILVLISCVLLSTAIMCYATFKATGYIEIHFGRAELFQTTLSKILIIFISLAISALIFILCSKISESSLNWLYKWAIAVIVVALVSNGIAQLAKHIFDRTRYRAMIYEGFTDFEYYTPWFLINTNKFASSASVYGDYFKSFPSGHCCAAASIFLLLLLPAFNTKLANKKFIIPTAVLCSLYTCSVAFSRIIAGAHYLTDTLIGSGITIVCIILYYHIIIKNKKIKYLSA